MDIVLRATIVFLFLLVFMRGLRKRSLGEMSPLQMIVLVVIGDLVQQGVTQEDYSLTGVLLAVGTFGFWVTALDHLSWRSGWFRRTVEGVPMVVVENGKPVEQTLRLERIPWEEVLESARQEGIDDISKVRLGVLEVSGKISFITADSL
jgi:uncharacterized membrane protein YcaP (DUF421 family)